MERLRSTAWTRGWRSLRWIAAGGALTACASSDGGEFTVPYRSVPSVTADLGAGGVTSSAGGSPSASGGRFAAGGSAAVCGQACAAVGPFAGCCLTATTCGVDVGFGVCVVVPVLPGTGGTRGGAGGTDARSRAPDASDVVDAAVANSDASPDGASPDGAP